jgi:hypothetical protein
MALTTYAELKTSIGDWLNRSDLTSVIPDFISLAEAQVERTLRTRQMIVRANASFDAQYGAVPSDFLETKSLKLTSTNPQTPLEFLSIDALDQKAAEYTASGKPRFFGVVGGQLRIVPTPDSTYTTELTYYAKLSKLSTSNTSNWLLSSSPDIYLYGALLQAAPYLQDDARIQTWATLYERALNDLQTADDRSATSGGALLTRAKTFG